MKNYDHSFPTRKVVEQLDLNRLTIRLTLIDDKYKTDDLDVNRRQSGRQSSSIQYIIYSNFGSVFCQELENERISFPNAFHYDHYDNLFPSRMRILSFYSFTYVPSGIFRP